MTVSTHQLQLETDGDAAMTDITGRVAEAVVASGLRDGTVTIFCPGSTGAVTTIEFESGALADLRRHFEELVPENRDYQHNLRWGDGNGHSHVRAALLGPSLTVPMVDGRMTLGTWQQIIHLDFDNRPRRRTLIIQVMGE